MALPFNRRTFLAASAGEAPSGPDALNVLFASYLTVAGVEQRLAFGVSPRR